MMPVIVHCFGWNDWGILKRTRNELTQFTSFSSAFKTYHQCRDIFSFAIQSYLLQFTIGVAGCYQGW
jgi:ABC-type transporter Mla maintaining outer membrane lipid asymmetry permease subunit MlaE